MYIYSNSVLNRIKKCSLKQLISTKTKKKKLSNQQQLIFIDTIKDLMKTINYAVTEKEIAQIFNGLLNFSFSDSFIGNNEQSFKIKI